MLPDMLLPPDDVDYRRDSSHAYRSTIAIWRRSPCLPGAAVPITPISSPATSLSRATTSPSRSAAPTSSIAGGCRRAGVVDGFHGQVRQRREPIEWTTLRRRPFEGVPLSLFLSASGSAGAGRGAVRRRRHRPGPRPDSGRRRLYGFAGDDQRQRRRTARTGSTAAMATTWSAAAATTTASTATTATTGSTVAWATTSSMAAPGSDTADYGRRTLSGVSEAEELRRPQRRKSASTRSTSSRASRTLSAGLAPTS